MGLIFSSYGYLFYAAFIRKVLLFEHQIFNSTGVERNCEITVNLIKFK